MVDRRGILYAVQAFRQRLRDENPHAVDTVVALTLLVAMFMVGTAYHPGEWRRFDLAAYLLTASTCLPLAARRAAPMLTHVAVSVAYVAYLELGFYPSLNFYGPMIAFYTVATTKASRTTTIAALILGGVLFYSALVVPELPIAVAVAQSTAPPLVLWGVAGVSRRLSLRNRQLAEATVQLRREQERRVEHAVGQERLQIARELHDVVAHHISVISMQAGLARYVFDSDPPTARAAVDTIGEISRETLEELRRVLNLLRTSDTPLDSETALIDAEPVPVSRRLEELVERVRGVGLDVSLRISGAVAELPSGLQLTVYRVVQEALTNVIKHVGPCEADVSVHRDFRQLSVTITNERKPGTAPTATVEPADGGNGLLGMHERARLYGGTLVAGPRPDGGYTVVLTVPWP
ncbi:sensor histidine kinase [Nocardia tenerifensis]|uniref:sensor histidine kinase n=1 Tax=Nocardia tenerifensis TaxID=228006 RepID=UPI0003036317|nr:histidine kinase [Nocardia tenerifensis]